jgi:hypothetical protein
MIICNQDPSRFYGVETIQDNSLISSIEENMKSFIDYGFLNIGAFVNVNTNTSGLYSLSFDKCKPTNDPSRPANTVWQTPRKDWVWEKDINYKNISPIQISGVNINGSFFAAPSGSGSGSYSLDYPNGQIIFNNPVSPSANVSLSYSYRWCQVYKSSSSSDVWKTIQQLTFQPNEQLNQQSKGIYSVLANHRIQLPAIVIEPAPQNDSKPYELGSLSAFRSQDFLLHIYAENTNDCNKIMDIIRLQEDKVVVMYDLNKVVSDKIYGLLPNGSINPSGQNYGQLIQNKDYHWNYALLKNITFVDIQKNPTSNFVWCMIRLTTESII